MNTLLVALALATASVVGRALWGARKTPERRLQLLEALQIFDGDGDAACVNAILLSAQTGIPKSTIYALLRSLVDEGYVSIVQLYPTAPGGLTRYCYATTARGSHYLQTQKASTS